MRVPRGIKSKFVLAVLTAFVLVVTSPASAGWWSDDTKVDMSFHGVFPRPFYKQSSFGWAILGTTVVAAAAVSYFTAGAGAPAAATGVSTVATAVGGGGAGAYMAGLSTIGGWVGGNAMVGAAMLNGISLTLGGGGAAFATLSAAGKVGVLASTTATALDGVLIYRPQDNQKLRYEIRLAVPQAVGSEATQGLAEAVSDNAGELLKAGSENNRAAWDVAYTRRSSLASSATAMGEQALTAADNPADLLVLGVINKNLGNSRIGDRLINQIPINALSNTGYLDYLKSVIALEGGRVAQAEQLLRQSAQSDPYAIEPVLLLINLLNEKGFGKNQAEIVEWVKGSAENFDRDEYDTGYGMLALNYRLATMYFLAEEYAAAQESYEEAYDSIALMQERLGSKQVRNMVRLGIANSMYMQGLTYSAEALMSDVLDDAGSYEEKQKLLVQFCANRQCSRT